MEMLDKFREINSEISNFLQIKIIDKPFLKINLWFIVHLFSGFIIMFLINKFKSFKYKYLLFLELLILWELFEAFMRFTGFTFFGLFVFKFEAVLDTILDIIIGMFGGYIYMKFFK